MGIQSELHPIHVTEKSGQYVLLAKSCFSMTDEEKRIFYSVLKDAKLPQGCVSNLSRCVDIEAKKVTGYKSHDAHFIMQYLLQVAVKKSLPKHVAVALIRLGSFFRNICMKVVKQSDLANLQVEIAETLCQLEKIFPPSFFDIMVHLPVHLINQIKLVGPVHCSWMYSTERYLCELKSQVRNRSQPEGSIAEGYLAKECLTFCSRYLEDEIKTNNDNNISSKQDICAYFVMQGYPVGGKKNKTGKSFAMKMDVLHQAHRYILFNCQDKEVEKYIKEHQKLTEARSKRSRWARAQAHSQEFCKWFASQIRAKTESTSESVPSHILWLSKGPNTVAKRYFGYFINGYKFSTRKRDGRCKTQNSGVTLTALTPSFASSKDQNPITGYVNYYGAIEEIIEVNYMGNFNIVLFKCVWFQEEKDDFGIPKVNFNKLCYTDDPFVMANQVHQAFYIKDPTEEEYHYVIRYIPRNLFQLNEEQGDDISNTCWGELNDSSYKSSNIDNYVQTGCSREDVPKTVVNLSSSKSNSQVGEISSCDDESDFDDTDWDWIESIDPEKS